MPQGYLYAHHALLDGFRNATAWPKHLLVQYAWAQAPSADALASLYLALAACAPLVLCALKYRTPPKPTRCSHVCLWLSKAACLGDCHPERCGK